MTLGEAVLTSSTGFALARVGQTHNIAERSNWTSD